MAFHEVRFPDNISRGARGGPERRTQIVELASGDEERNASWANSRRRYDVAYGIRRADDLAAVVAFFEARNGRLHGFRFKDWGDHKSCLPSGTPSPTDQTIGTGDGTTTAFQLVKHYASGDEERNASWANSRRRYDVAYGIRRADDLAAVVAFFEARNGRLHGFRFKDWGDHKSCLPSGTPSPTDQAIGTGDGTTTAFQLVKRYASGAQSWTRAIAKPVAGSVRIALDGVEQGSGWSVDTATGVVTFSAAPGSGVAVTAGFEFDVPVRFDTDVLDVTLDLERLGSITSIPLLELRR